MLFASPSDEFESSVELEVGDYDHRKIKAMINALYLMDCLCELLV